MSELPHPVPFECYQSSVDKVLESKRLLNNPKLDELTRFKLLKQKERIIDQIAECDCFEQYVLRSLSVLLAPPHPLVRAARKGIRQIK